MAICDLLAAAPASGEASAPGALDPTEWAESIRALAGTGAAPVPIAPPRRMNPLDLARLPVSATPSRPPRDAASRSAA